MDGCERFNSNLRPGPGGGAPGEGCGGEASLTHF